MEVLSPEIMVLLASAAGIAFVHTLMGPDHYLPLVSMAAARRWSWHKLIAITLICGAGHLLGSVALGLFGIWAQSEIAALVAIENWRGDIAAWLLFSFGLAYLAWGLRQAHRNNRHSHWHHHGELYHCHDHDHHREHLHLHEAAHAHGTQAERISSFGRLLKKFPVSAVRGVGRGESGVYMRINEHFEPSNNEAMCRQGFFQRPASITPWVIFVIFVLGPCEPLIPLLMYPAAGESVAGVLLVTGVFGAITVLTMLAAVVISFHGVRRFKLDGMGRYGQAMAGATLSACGASILFLGV